MTDRSRRRERRIPRWLGKSRFPDELERPLFRAANIQFKVTHWDPGTDYGRIYLVHRLVRTLGLAEAIDQRLHLLKLLLTYHESDYALNILQRSGRWALSA